MLCGGVGTYDEHLQTCACPLTHAGARCELPRLPACSLGSGEPSLRPLFWVRQVTVPLSLSAATAALRTSLAASIGALPCACVLELLSITAAHRSKWSLLPNWFVCADDASMRSAPDGSEAKNLTLGSLLEEGGAGQQWVNWTVRYNSAAHAYYTGSRPPVSMSLGTVDSFFAWRLLPISRCPLQCGYAGWCVAPVGAWLPTHSAHCRCFPEAVFDRGRRSCLRVQYATSHGPSRDTSHKGVDPELHVAESHPEPWVGHAAATAQTLPLREASSASVAFNFARCPLNCSARGSCDLGGFCRCDRAKLLYKTQRLLACACQGLLACARRVPHRASLCERPCVGYGVPHARVQVHRWILGARLWHQLERRAI